MPQSDREQITYQIRKLKYEQNKIKEEMGGMEAALSENRTFINLVNILIICLYGICIVLSLAALSCMWLNQIEIGQRIFAVVPGFLIAYLGINVFRTVVDFDFENIIVEILRHAFSLGIYGVYLAVKTLRHKHEIRIELRNCGEKLDQINHDIQELENQLASMP